MNPGQSKIFGIGLSKTGTTSLAHALEILGYKTRDYLGVTRYSSGDLSSIDLDEIDTNDAFTDTPVPSFYRELDARYPGSKFILTVRDTDGWLQSCKKQFTQKLAEKLNKASNQLFMDLYECTVFDEEKFRRGYENFTSGVYQYFNNRTQDLLVMDIAAGDDWEKLCSFLDVPIPDIPFPRANVTRIRWLDINEIIAVAQKAGHEILRAQHIVQTNNKEQKGRKTKQRGIARIALESARYVVLGGADGIQRSVIKRVDRIISKSLKELNPHIPVISRQNNSTSLSERRKWNHFWLVDPLDSNAGLLAPGEDFTINIGLIEDRKPVLGIVYVPAKNTIYYTMTGKDAFRIEADGKPILIEAYTTKEQKQPALTEQGEISRGAKMEYAPQPASTALSMCLTTEGKLDISMPLSNTMEWETAGAHAIIKSAGMTVINCDTNSELAYNKKNLRTDSLVIK
jgi:3'-phosphoadenosine 5'-phosphosulfate (PAPS) 3'-phosphatase